jgi:hypothetical protein
MATQSPSNPAVVGANGSTDVALIDIYALN